MLSTFLRRTRQLKSVSCLANKFAHTKCNDTELKGTSQGEVLPANNLSQGNKSNAINDKYKLVTDESLNVKKVQNENCQLDSQTIPNDNRQNEDGAQTLVVKTNFDITDTRTLLSDDYADFKFEKKSALDTFDEDIADVAPYLRPTFNFAAYINKSETLQKLLLLGVELYKLEGNTDYMQFIFGLNFENDVQNRVLFLKDLGLEIESIAKIITKNPFILKTSIEEMQIRVHYLEYKKFSKDMIVRILTLNASWLTYSTQQIDEKLGFFQKQFNLTGSEIRELVTKQPKLITYKFRHVKLNIFALHEEMGFTLEEMKIILLNKPKLFMKSKKILLETFDYMHNTMKVSTEAIVQFPDILTCRVHRLKQRHLFLEKLGKIQFNPKLPNYIGITSLVAGTDVEFCNEVAKCSVQTYNTFLKTL